MKINELLMSIKEENFDIKKELQVKTYLPIEVKKTIAQAIIYDCTNSEYGVIKIDSVKKYMSYVKYMITTYTNLEYTDENYDALCSTEYNGTTLLNAIMDCFDDDAKECARILNLMIGDYMQEMKIEFTVAKFLHNLNEAIEGLTGNIGGFDLSSMIPDSVDMNKLGTFLQDYVK